MPWQSRALLAAVADEFQPNADLHGASFGTGMDHVRGAIALALGRVDAAERWFKAGLDWGQHWGVDTTSGRNLYGLAQVEERRGDHALAMQHLDAAGALFAKRGAKLYLDQVIAKKTAIGV